MGGGIGRFKFDGLAIFGDSFIDLASVAECGSEVRVSLGESPPDSDCLLEPRYSVFNTFLLRFGTRRAAGGGALQSEDHPKVVDGTRIATLRGQVS